MATYRGKMNWGARTTNESFTVVLPQGSTVREDDPIHLYWKWSQGDNVFCQTVIYDVKDLTNEGKTEFRCLYNNRYILDLTSRNCGAELSIVMRDDTQCDRYADCSCPMILKKVRYDPEPHGLQCHSRQHTQVYAGLFNFFCWAAEEVFVLVLPKGLGDGLPVSVHSQWTTTADRPPKYKQNIDTFTPEQTLKKDPCNCNAFEFEFKAYYRVRITKSRDAETLSVDFSQNSGGQMVHFKLRLQPI